MEKKKTIYLSVYQFDWYCPKCEQYEIVDKDDVVDGNETKDVTCSTCKTVYSSIFNY